MYAIKQVSEDLCETQCVKLCCNLLNINKVQLSIIVVEHLLFIKIVIVIGLHASSHRTHIYIYI